MEIKRGPTEHTEHTEKKENTEKIFLLTFTCIASKIKKEI